MNFSVLHFGSQLLIIKASGSCLEEVALLRAAAKESSERLELVLVRAL